MGIFQPRRSLHTPWLPHEKDNSSQEQWPQRGSGGTDPGPRYLLGDGGLEPDPELSTSGCLERRLSPRLGAPEALGEGEVELPHAQCRHQPPQRLREEPVVRDCVWAALAPALLTASPRPLHRHTERFGLRATIKITSFQRPATGRDTFRWTGLLPAP